jgi:hypothetical protein
VLKYFRPSLVCLVDLKIKRAGVWGLGEGAGAGAGRGEGEEKGEKEMEREGRGWDAVTTAR